ncbi:hypothetical protein BGW36DRAFT_397246 [Talaromyces proteolyticus]|uniref:SUZ-C domain-containing protein n=1 Tax=Talaromyces proteolyticus TaxID=1131652 RepID=A0AAD4KPN1_9EURO|nr:uncharacterized protein BGW36DRAFT_397246 [Talaromyces proteolyticus]KAH8697567.1 hypothetical protein BGW36DRAFT_397246 [Talaromyces proteolyticus]
MSSEQDNVPDAWEADWESLDQDPNSETASLDKKVSSKVSKAQRRAAQAEFNRQLWAEADAPQTFHYLESRSAVPLKQEYRPAVTVLSRRPQIASRNGENVKGADAVAAGISGLSLNGRELSDSEDESNKPPEMTPEERQAKALKDREEKQRKYEEVRERLFGSSSTPGSGASSPGGTPPPSRNQSSGGGDGNRGRGRNRGGGRDNTRDKRDSPGNSMGKQRQLYDPTYSTKPNSTYIQRKDRQQQSSTDKSDGEQQVPKQPIRSPRGPDSNGRGGFGFSPRGRGV